MVALRFAELYEVQQLVQAGLRLGGVDGAELKQAVRRLEACKHSSICMSSPCKSHEIIRSE